MQGEQLAGRGDRGAGAASAARRRRHRHHPRRRFARRPQLVRPAGPGRGHRPLPGAGDHGHRPRDRPRHRRPGGPPGLQDADGGGRVPGRPDRRRRRPGSTRPRGELARLPAWAPATTPAARRPAPVRLERARARGGCGGRELDARQAAARLQRTGGRPAWPRPAAPAGRPAGAAGQRPRDPGGWRAAGHRLRAWRRRSWSPGRGAADCRRRGRGSGTRARAWPARPCVHWPRGTGGWQPWRPRRACSTRRACWRAATPSPRRRTAAC